MAVNNKRQISKTPTAYITFGVTLLILMAIIGISTFLRANEIRVEGIAIYSREEIVESSGLSLGDNLFFVKATTISKNIRQALPFVKTAEISRVLPDKIFIEISESVAIASIAFAGDLLILDSSGRVLAQTTGNENTLPGIYLEDLIEVRGVEINDMSLGVALTPALGTESKLLNMQDVLNGLERDDLYGDVSYLDVSNTGNIQFGYMNMYRVVLGGISDLRHKLGILPSAVSDIQLNFPNTPGDIDLSDPSDVRFRPT